MASKKFMAAFKESSKSRIYGCSTTETMASKKNLTHGNDNNCTFGLRDDHRSRRFRPQSASTQQDFKSRQANFSFSSSQKDREETQTSPKRLQSPASRMQQLATPKSPLFKDFAESRRNFRRGRSVSRKRERKSAVEDYYEKIINDLRERRASHKPISAVGRRTSAGHTERSHLREGDLLVASGEEHKEALGEKDALVQLRVAELEKEQEAKAVEMAAAVVMDKMARAGGDTGNSVNSQKCNLMANAEAQEAKEAGRGPRKIKLKRRKKKAGGMSMTLSNRIFV